MMGAGQSLWDPCITNIGGPLAPLLVLGVDGECKSSSHPNNQPWCEPLEGSMCGHLKRARFLGDSPLPYISNEFKRQRMDTSLRLGDMAVTRSVEGWCLFLVRRERL